MIAASLHPHETERLRRLQTYEVLDTGSEQTFDDLTRLAAAICGTPMSTITLIDEHRQWFKSRVGIPGTGTSRDLAFCAHAILSDEIMIVEDATADTRFADNPLVTGDPGIRFYAGAPLTIEGGLALGTLCVIDRVPRTLTPAQRDALSVLRRAVVTQLDLRIALKHLADLERIVPMCAWCRAVRNHEGGWTPLERYVERSQGITHGICPTCAASVEQSIRR